MTAKTNPPAAKGIDDLASNIAGADSDGGNMALEAAPVAERRVKIILEESDQIPPNGQFFGADGKGYQLRPGEECEVPMSIINILDTAVMSVPITDAGQRVIGYRDRLRFPYRVITAERAAA